MTGLCEWNPKLNDNASTPPAEGDCRNRATTSIGDGKWHLCESCAKLPRFKRFKKTPLRRDRTCADEIEPDYGGVLGADNQVHSDADPGL